MVGGTLPDQQAYLSRHDGPRRHMPHLADGASIAVTEILQDLEIFSLQVQLVLDANLQLRRLPSIVVCVAAGNLEVALGGRDWPRGRCSQRETLDVLPLQRPHGTDGVGHVGLADSNLTLLCVLYYMEVGGRLVPCRLSAGRVKIADGRVDLGGEDKEVAAAGRSSVQQGR